MTSALHWAFKHIHDEPVTILERNGERDASKRITSLLVPIEEQLTFKLDNDINRVPTFLFAEQPMTIQHQYEQLY